MNRNVPKLRFKGFDNEWKEKKLGQITKLTDGVHFTPEYVESGVPFWSVETLASGAKPKFITKQAHDLAIKRCHPQLNDILITRIGTLAKSKVITTNNELSIYVSVALIKASKEFNSKFMKQYFDSNFYYKEFLSKSLLTATPKKINMEDLKGTRVNIPSLQEQEKIANFLTKVDSLIEEQDGKVQDLGLYKKGMMQKIFSQKIRFKDDNGCEYPEWEKKHLEEFVERVVRKNKGNASNKPLTISAQYGLVNQEEFFNKVVASKNLEGYYLLNKGEFAYNKSYSNGYPFGAIKRLDRYENGAVSTLYVCFKPKHDVNSNYLVQYFESNKWHNEVSMIAVEGARNHGLLNVSVSDFFATIHKFPCLEEQTKIANFLSNIDLIIEEEKNKLEDLRQWKKGLLQQMFV